MFDDAHVFVMAVDGDELLERQRLAAFLQAMTGVFVPVALQLLVRGGEAAGERRVEDDGKLRPVDIGVAIPGLFWRFDRRAAGFGRFALLVEDFLQLEQQLLRSADTERRNEHRALVGQRPLDGSLQPLAAVRAILVAAVAIGAFENQQIGAFGRNQVRQQR